MKIMQIGMIPWRALFCMWMQSDERRLINAENDDDVEWMCPGKREKMIFMFATKFSFAKLAKVFFLSLRSDHLTKLLFDERQSSDSRFELCN